MNPRFGTTLTEAQKSNIVAAKAFVQRLLEEPLGSPPAPGASLSEAEAWYIKAMLQKYHGHINRAARMLGCSSRKVQKRLKEWRTLNPMF